MPRKLLFIFLFAVFVRMVFFYIASVQSGETSRAVIPYLDGYYEIAENLLAGNGFSHSIASPIVPGSLRTPLYPLFMAGLVFVFKNYYAVLIAQIILGSFIPILAYRIAIQILPNERIAKIVAFILVFEPLTVQLSVTLMSETFFTVFLLFGITFFFDYIKRQQGNILAYATCLLALATLARPTIQFIPLLLILFVVFLSRKNMSTAIQHSLIVVGVFLLILAPWCVRNFVRFGNPALSVQYASVPYGYLIPSTIALEQHIGFEEAKREFYAGEGNIESVEDITLANAKEYQKRIAPILQKHPIGLMKSVTVTAFTFFTHDGYLDVLRRFGIAPSIRLERPAFTMILESPTKALAFITPLLKSPALFVILGRIAWIFITFFFIVGAFRYLHVPEQRVKGIFVLLVISYFILTTVAVGLAVNARFRMPVNALILTFAVYGAGVVAKRLRPKGVSSSDSSAIIFPPTDGKPTTTNY